MCQLGVMAILPIQTYCYYVRDGTGRAKREKIKYKISYSSFLSNNVIIIHKKLYFEVIISLVSELSKATVREGIEVEFRNFKLSRPQSGQTLNDSNQYW